MDRFTKGLQATHPLIEHNALEHVERNQLAANFCIPSLLDRPIQTIYFLH